MNAAIDIGTNTVLLLVGEVGDEGLNILREEYRIPRLGKGVDASRKLHSNSMQRVLDVLKEYKSILEENFPENEKLIITATSAVRDAKNRSEFLTRIKEEIGEDVLLLSGDDEAIYTYGGALASLPVKSDGTYVVLDIGGGSTEIASGRGRRLNGYTSVDMGCVRFTERFLKGNPATSEEISACRREVQKLLQRQELSILQSATAVGVAGTVTTLAAIKLKLMNYSAEAVNGSLISMDDIEHHIQLFSTQSFNELIKLSPEALKGRVDIFLAGLLILEGFLKYYNLNEIVVSTGGIRHGALLISEKD